MSPGAMGEGGGIRRTIAIAFATVCLVGIVISESDLLMNGYQTRAFLDGFFAEGFFLAFTVTAVLLWSSRGPRPRRVPKDGQ